MWVRWEVGGRSSKARLLVSWQITFSGWTGWVDSRAPDCLHSKSKLWSWNLLGLTGGVASPLTHLITDRERQSSINIIYTDTYIKTEYFFSSSKYFCSAWHILNYEFNLFFSLLNFNSLTGSVLAGVQLEGSEKFLNAILLPPVDSQCRACVLSLVTTL